MEIVRIENWAFKFFYCSTIFIIFFSVQAIYNWPPLAEKFSILLACTLPVGLTILSRAGLWLRTWKLPKELAWVSLVFFLGLLSCLLSDNKGASLKSMGLFLASGPFVFLATRFLFESKENQKNFLWMTSLCLMILAIWGIYEHFSLGIVYLFSRNPLPAGVLLVLLSSGPMVLLSQPNSRILKLAIILSLSSSVLLIILMTKKSHLLGLFVLLITLSVFSFRKYYKFFLGFILLLGLVFFTSDSIRTQYEKIFNWPDSTSTHSRADSEINKQNIPLAIYGSIPLRIENYFFGYHVIKKNPAWGLGFGGDLDPYFKDYNPRNESYFSKERYREYIKSLNTFENIVLTYTIEWGVLFSIIYFGGITYFVGTYLIATQKTAIKEMDGIFIIAILFSFLAISLTFDTLRYPNLNWVFHSLLGLLVNITPNHSKEL